MCNIPLTVIFYNLFKVVNRNVALMMVLLDVIVNAIESISLLGHFAPLLFLSGSHHLSAFPPEQLQALSYLSIQLFEHGFAICLVFFGFDCFAMAYLIYRSTFSLESSAYCSPSKASDTSSTASRSFFFLAEPRIFPYFAPTALAEIALCFWLLGDGRQRSTLEADGRSGGSAGPYQPRNFSGAHVRRE